MKINKVIELNAIPSFYLNRSYSYYALKNMAQAQQDALTAKQKGVILNAGYANSLGIQ